MDLNTQANRDSLIKIFPALGSDIRFVVTSRQTALYNCIAWALGFENRWVEPTPSTMLNFRKGRFEWWLEGIEESSEPNALKAVFEALGFSECESCIYEESYDKAVLYRKDGQWTHASRVVAPDEEHSKFGESWNAHHGHDMFSGTMYGEPYCYMRREHAQKRAFLSKFPLKMGSVTVNEAKALEYINLFRRLHKLPPIAD